MLKKIKRYKLDENVTIEDLLSVGFSENEETHLSYYKPLCDSIELFIDVVINEDGSLSFDDYYNVDVIDKNYNQYYSPFYESKKPFYFLDVVIYRYNEVMDDLVSKGILKLRIIDRDLEEDLPAKRMLKKD